MAHWQEHHGNAAILTPAQRHALITAATRPHGTLCPVVGARGNGLHAAVESTLLASLRRKGYCSESAIPTITPAGRAAIAGEPWQARHHTPDGDGTDFWVALCGTTEREMIYVRNRWGAIERFETESEARAVIARATGAAS